MFTFLSLIVYAALAIIGALFFLIVLHELGHFFAAKCFGVKVLRFSLGFGYPLFRYQTQSGTEYRISCLPFGGYVKLLDEREGKVTNQELPYSFTRKPIYQRFLILVAGVVVNLLAAVLAFALAAMIGYQVMIPQLAKVTPNSIASQAGLKSGDEIVAIDGWRTSDWQVIALAVISRIGDRDRLRMTVKQHGQLKQVELPLANWRVNPLKPRPLHQLGLIPADADNYPHLVRLKQLSVLPAVADGLRLTGYFITFNCITLAKLITGKISLLMLAGPITLFDAAITTFQVSFPMYLLFLAIVSIAIALVNALPIPALDGGHILFLLVEKLRGKPLSIAVQLLAYRLALIFLIVIAFQILVYDIVRLFAT